MMGAQMHDVRDGKGWSKGKESNRSDWCGRSLEIGPVLCLKLAPVPTGPGTRWSLRAVLQMINDLGKPERWKRC